MKKYSSIILMVLLAMNLIACGETKNIAEKNKVEITDESTNETAELPVSEPVEVLPEPTTEAESEIIKESQQEAVAEETPEVNKEDELKEEINEGVAFTYTEVSKTLYAKQTVNVRSGPATDFDKVGSLSTNDEVVVTGTCNETGWYRFEYNGNAAYVSNSYLVDEIVEVASPTETLSNAGENSSNNVESDIASLPRGQWVDCGDWFYIIADRQYGNVYENFYGTPQDEILMQRYPGATQGYGGGMKLKDGSGQWAWVMSVGEWKKPTLQDFWSKYCTNK